MFDYTKKSVEDILFRSCEKYELLPSPEWTDDYIAWQENNINTTYSKKDIHGYKIINGKGVVKGHLLGGCLDVFMMINGTTICPTLDEWSNAINNSIFRITYYIVVYDIIFPYKTC